jgi:hypothetical protein
MSPLTESTRLTLAKQSVAPGLLDAYGGAAAAYSLRRLSANYTGPVVRVRRSSDSTEQDFTATQVTDGTLTTFCGAGDGFVRTWYDQTINGRNASMTTTTLQPEIVISGSLVTYNSKPAFSITSSRGILLAPGLAGISRVDYFVVRNSTSTSNILFDDGIDGSISWIATQSSTNTTISVGFGSPAMRSNGVAQTITNRGNVFTAVNGYKLEATSNATFNPSGTPWASVRFFGYSRPTWAPVGSIQEMIFYSSNQTSNQAAIESNINAHYAIY